MADNGGQWRTRPLKLKLEIEFFNQIRASVCARERKEEKEDSGDGNSVFFL